MPLSVLMPAPVSTTTRSASATHPRRRPLGRPCHRPGGLRPTHGLRRALLAGHPRAQRHLVDAPPRERPRCGARRLRARPRRVRHRAGPRSPARCQRRFPAHAGPVLPVRRHPLPRTDHPAGATQAAAAHAPPGRPAPRVAARRPRPVGRQAARRGRRRHARPGPPARPLARRAGRGRCRHRTPAPSLAVPPGARQRGDGLGHRAPHRTLGLPHGRHRRLTPGGDGFPTAEAEVIGSASGTHGLGLLPTEPMTSRLPPPPPPTSTPPAPAPRRRARRRPGTVVARIAAATAVLVGACSGDGDGDDEQGERETPVTTEATPVLATRDDPLPVVTPTPRDVRWLGPDVVVSATVTVLAEADADPGAVDAVREVLEAAGATDVAVAEESGAADERDGTDDGRGDGGEGGEGGEGADGGGGAE